MLSKALIEDIDGILADLNDIYTVRGKGVQGQPFSTLSNHLRSSCAPSGRNWKSLGSRFYHELEESGYRIDPGKGTKPGQRASREVVYKV